MAREALAMVAATEPGIAAGTLLVGGVAPVSGRPQMDAK